jgi:hypothetical protein
VRLILERQRPACHRPRQSRQWTQRLVPALVSSARAAPSWGQGVETLRGRGELDREGRLQRAHFGHLSVVNACFPDGTQRDSSRAPFELDSCRALFERLAAPRAAASACW